MEGRTEYIVSIRLERIRNQKVVKMRRTDIDEFPNYLFTTAFQVEFTDRTSKYLEGINLSFKPFFFLLYYRCTDFILHLIFILKDSQPINVPLANLVSTTLINSFLK